MLRSLPSLLFSCLALSVLLNCAGSKKSQATQLVSGSDDGKELFTTHCVSCHAMENEEIGPRLGGVTSLLSEKELVAFVKNPGQAIESGNARAVGLSKRYKMIMPPFDFLKDDEIKAILSYVAAETKLHNIAPLEVKVHESGPAARLAAPVMKSDLRIELEDFVTIPASAEKMPRTRIANMRPHPAHDGSLFVSDQRGIIYKIDRQKNITEFLDLRPLVENFVNEPGLGTGLGSFAFHPDYLSNGLIYITHTESFKGKPADYQYDDSVKVALQWVVSEWKADDPKNPVFKGNRRELIRINVPNVVHGTQDIGFAPGLKKGDRDYGLLYIGTGDGGSTISKHPELCHKLTSLLGTIIRIDPLERNSSNGRYGIPEDNPFMKEINPAVFKEIYAYGFRNPHRLAWHDGNLFSAEVGESNFEEVNVIIKGGDYGWNVREGNYGISSKDLKNVYPVPDAGNFVKPFLIYDHLDGNAISGGSVYEGSISALKDKYIFGDIVNGRIFYAHITKAFTDSTVHELGIVSNAKDTDLMQMSGSKRVDLRIEYDPFTKEMYMMTKSDGKIRRISKAYLSTVH
jgi:glucose/arabinose dehydrogenase/mono/diheme cytochrome c family protein